jgi:hypothetical protein
MITENFDLVDNWQELNIPVSYIYCSTCTTYRNRVSAKDAQYFGTFNCSNHN